MEVEVRFRTKGLKALAILTIKIQKWIRIHFWPGLRTKKGA